MPQALVLYHYFHPDDVVSAVHMAELCQELSDRGWDVTAMPCNRSCRDGQRAFQAKEYWGDVKIQRVWRPSTRQSSHLGRIFNSAWMIARWSFAALNRKKGPEVLIVGTDPVLSVLVACVWKWFRPETQIVHWCFDLYPEAAIANGWLRHGSLALNITRSLLKRAYDACDLIADIGPCMKRKLDCYPSDARRTTLTPWALAEPAYPLLIDAAERKSIFGDTSLALLYSGSFGRAHSFGRLVKLAKLLEPAGAKLAFSVRGNRVGDLVRAARSQPNILHVPFAPQERLEARLSAADIHVVSLRDDWTGTVVPSKFFGSLAAGRPLIFAGSPGSAIAAWIREYRVGWVLTHNNLEEVVEELRYLSDSPEALRRMFHHCHYVYQQNFSKRHVTDMWNYELRRLMGDGDQELEVRSAQAAGVSVR